MKFIKKILRKIWSNFYLFTASVFYLFMPTFQPGMNNTEIIVYSIFISTLIICQLLSDIYLEIKARKIKHEVVMSVGNIRHRETKIYGEHDG